MIQAVTSTDSKLGSAVIPQPNKFFAYLIIPNEVGSGLFLIKGAKTWRIPRASMTRRQFEVAWKHPCNFTDDQHSVPLKFAQTVLAPGNCVLPKDYLMRTLPLREASSLKLVAWEDLLERKLSLMTRHLLLLWMGAIATATAADLNQEKWLERLREAALD